MALLLFSLGLELSFDHLRSMGRAAFLGGPVQIAITWGAATAAASFFLAMGTTEAVWFGAMISVSSSVVVLKTLSATGMTQTLASRVMIAWLVIQDLAVAPMLVILPQLGDTSRMTEKLLRALGASAVLGVAIAAAGKWVLPQLLRLVLRWKSDELFLVSVVATGVGVGYAAYTAGLSFALGAFIAGLVLSECEFRGQARQKIEPLRDIFGMLFFVSVGMLLDPKYVTGHARVIVATVVLIMVGKAVLLGLLARAFGYLNNAPWIIGLELSQIGEFSFVLARSGVAYGLLSKSTYDFALTYGVDDGVVADGGATGVAVGSGVEGEEGLKWTARGESTPF